MKKKTLKKQDMKQILTKQDIQKDLLAHLKIFKRTYHIYFVLLLISFAFRFPEYIKYLLITILIVSVIVFARYFTKLYKIKKGKFQIIEDELIMKDRELHKYSTRIENSLFFRCGSILVEDDVYSYSRAGDTFYVITLKSKLKSKNKPVLGYHTKYYEITPF